ncbi:hypothetical protein GCM10020219_100450 [Nonomuraea dietziae]
MRGRTHSTSRPRAGQQLAQLAAAEAAGDAAIGPRHEHDLAGLAQVRPVVLLGQYRHAEDQGVDADQGAPARTQHADHVLHRRLGHQLDRQRALLGHHRVHAPVGQERQIVGANLAHPVGIAQLRLPLDGAAEVDHLDHLVPGLGGLGGPAAPAAGKIEDHGGTAGKPAAQLLGDDRTIKGPVRSERP